MAGRAPAVAFESRPIRPLEDVHTRYYLRLVAADRPGVIAAIANILGELRISLASVIQKEEVPAAGRDRDSEKYAEIVFMTHEAHEAAVQQARRAIAELPSVARIGSVIRVED